jgi:uncharacterized protein
LTEFLPNPAELTILQWSVLALVALLIGMAKTGIHGAGMMSVPLLANVFGGQLSSGIMLPILVMADVIGVWYYHQHASWEHLKGLFPWAGLGVILGTWVGQFLDEAKFRLMMAAIIYISLGIMLWLERHATEVPTKRTFTITSGIAGGFTSMVGNLANSVMALYFLSARLPKNVFIGTTAWFFLAVNWFKVPFHLWVWKTITPQMVLTDIMMLPMIVMGAFLGILLVKKFSNQTYRWFIIVMTAVSALFMLF